MDETPFQRLRFLVVDDSAHVRRLLRTILYAFGSREIQEADDGMVGLEMVERYNPDIMITDLMMPHTSGFDLVERLRDPETSPAPEMPIIMITGFAEKRHVLRARELGVTEFLCKPFSANSVYTRVMSICRRTERHDKDEPPARPATPPQNSPGTPDDPPPNRRARESASAAAQDENAVGLVEL